MLAGFTITSSRTGARPEPAQDPALLLVDLLDSFGPAYVRRLDALARDAAPSRVRIRALGALHCHGEQTLGALAGHLGVTPRRVTELVTAMADDGLLARRAHPTDGRSALVDVTPAGRALFDRSWEQQRTAAAEVFRGLPEGDQHELLRILGQVDAALARATPDPSGPAC